MNTVQRIFKNYFSLTVSQIATNFMGVITVAYLARKLGPNAFGKLNFALSVVGYFAILSHFGLNTIGTREIASYKDKASVYVFNIIFLKTLFGVVSYIFLAFFVYMSANKDNAGYLILVYGLTIFTANVYMFDWVYQGLEQMEFLAVSNILVSISYLAMLMFFVKNVTDTVYVPWILFVSQLFAVIFLFLLFISNSKSKITGFALDKDLSFNLIRKAAPVGISGIMTVVVLNFPTTLLGYLCHFREVGFFNAANKIAVILSQIVLAYATAIFPTISYYYRHSADKFGRIVNFTLRLIIAIGIPSCTGIFILSNRIIRFIYGESFGDAHLLLRILILSAFFIYLHVIFSFLLWATNLQRKVLKITVVQAGMTLFLCTVLGGVYGSAGVCYGILITSVTVAILYYVQAKALFNLGWKKDVLKSLISSFVMAAVISAIPGMNLFLLICVGAIVYFICLFVFQGINKDDINTALVAFKERKK
ncbi:MAG: putative O-antigen transporter [Elusimicrobia bacterium ADurb.Bin231]|nr:MAG: putative O-antigen transporter [Elusimicrobia bacterium ADurb.Bin231]